jgi:hypothetical protein
MSGNKTLRKIVQEKFPTAEVQPLTDIQSPMRRSAIQRKAPGLQVMQSKVMAEKFDSARPPQKAKARVAAARKKSKKSSGPSGVMVVSPKNADGFSRRQGSKAVIVSRGKVIALQG